MKPATLEQIGAIGHVEKHAARLYVTVDGVEPKPDFRDPAVAGLVRMAFLQGIAWERSCKQEAEPSCAHSHLPGGMGCIRCEVLAFEATMRRQEDK